MSERLSEIRAHIVATHQLETVITAMRGVAAARMREAQMRLEGVRAYASTLGDAIGSALTLAEDEKPQAALAPRRACGHILLAFCSAQGFVGAFNERILAAARRAAASSKEESAAFFVIGERGEALAAEQALKVSWATPMAPHVEEAPALADRIAGALYERLGENHSARVTLIHGAPDSGSGASVVERPLIPLDFTRFPPSKRKTSPLATLRPEALVASLAQEYVFAELCEAVVLSFAAENEARMQAMIAARSNVRKSLDGLEARYRRQRQDEITDEIIELARSR
jgi:F-type H+-transporting ATPase subunit gamma